MVTWSLDEITEASLGIISAWSCDQTNAVVAVGSKSAKTPVFFEDPVCWHEKKDEVNAKIISRVYDLLKRTFM